MKTAGSAGLDPARAADWMHRWKQNILSKTNRPCDVEMGEEIGWRVNSVPERVLPRLTWPRATASGSTG